LKALRDEGLPHALRHDLREHEAFTAEYMGWKGKANGELLALAEADHFDVLVTPDQAIPDEQNPSRLHFVGVVILATRDTRLRALRSMMSHILAAVANAQPGGVVRVEPTGRILRS